MALMDVYLLYTFTRRKFGGSGPAVVDSFGSFIDTIISTDYPVKIVINKACRALGLPHDDGEIFVTKLGAKL